MSSKNKILKKFKSKKIDGLDYYSVIQVNSIIDMAYEQVKNGEQIDEPSPVPISLSSCPDCGNSVYNCKCQ